MQNLINSEIFNRNALFERKIAMRYLFSLSMRVSRYSKVICKKTHDAKNHEHTLYELIIPLQKDYMCHVNDMQVIVHPDELFLVQPGDKHEDHYYCDEEIAFLVFQLFDMHGVLWQHDIWAHNIMPQERVIKIPSNSILDKSIHIMHDRDLTDPRKILGFNKLCESIFWEIISITPQQLLSPELCMVVDENIFQQLVFNYFSTNSSSRLDVGKMAKHMGLCKRSLEYKFRLFMNTCPTQAFSEYKMRMAIQMLDQGKDIKTISDLLGFSDQFNFSTAFKRVIGVPPSEYVRK